MGTFLRIGLAWIGVALALGAVTGAQKPPLLPEKDVAALASELSGETAKRNLEGIARFHRQRGSRGFHEAAELVAERLRAYGLSDVAILQFPADGKIFYGTQRSRPAWDAEEAELTEIRTDARPVCGKEKVENERIVLNTDCEPAYSRKIASYEAEPTVLAEDSESADVAAELVDLGQGTKEHDYSGKDVKGKIVLVSAQPGAVQDLAVGKFGAVGIVSYAQNQKTAWWGEDENLIRWGHLETFSANKTFGFMVSLKTARGMKERLAKGETIRLHAVVKAGQHAGFYEVVTATIPGADPKLRDEEIAFSCHLDHQRPGANDNASGCVTILEIARTLQRLIGAGALNPPARTIRFIFPPEIEGTMALLTGKAWFTIKLKEHGKGKTANEEEIETGTHSPYILSGPELAKRIKAVVHMDMVGGGPETKAVFHVTRGPMSLPSFVHDVAWAFAEWVNEESYKFAATGRAEYPLVAAGGGKEPLRAEYSAYTMGSDHDVYQDSSFGIPAIYLNDWPDRYIHTNFDAAANIDPTKLQRAAFIGAASGYFLAGDPSIRRSELAQVAYKGELVRSGLKSTRSASVSQLEAEQTEYEYCAYERQIEKQLHALKKGNGESPEAATDKETKCWTSYPPFGPYEPITSEVVKLPVKRKDPPRGPLVVFGYDYFAVHAQAAGVTAPKLLGYEGLWGSGEEYAYEVLNFADGTRSMRGIWSSITAEYGPIPFDMVEEYLRALEKIGVVEQLK